MHKEITLKSRETIRIIRTTLQPQTLYAADEYPRAVITVCKQGL